MANGIAWRSGVRRRPAIVVRLPRRTRRLATTRPRLRAKPARRRDSIRSGRSIVACDPSARRSLSAVLPARSAATALSTYRPAGKWSRRDGPAGPRRPASAQRPPRAAPRARARCSPPPTPESGSDTEAVRAVGSASDSGRIASRGASGSKRRRTGSDARLRSELPAESRRHSRSTHSPPPGTAMPPPARRSLRSRRRPPGSHRRRAAEAVGRACDRRRRPALGEVLPATANPFERRQPSPPSSPRRTLAGGVLST